MDEEIILYTMRHEVKRSKYYFSLFNGFDLCIWIVSCIVGFVFFTRIVLADGDKILMIVFLSILIIYFIFLVVMTIIPIDVYHNGIGLLICCLKCAIEKEKVVWGGIDYGFKSLQEKEERAKERKTKNLQRRKERS